MQVKMAVHKCQRMEKAKGTTVNMIPQKVKEILVNGAGEGCKAPV